MFVGLLLCAVKSPPTGKLRAAYHEGGLGQSPDMLLLFWWLAASNLLSPFTSKLLCWPIDGGGCHGGGGYHECNTTCYSLMIMISCDPCMLGCMSMHDSLFND